MHAAFDEALCAQIRRWMFDIALPFWAERGLDRRYGGPVESLSLDGAGPSGAPFKRTRVVCRQLYVYSHAQVLGWAPAGAIADALYDYLVHRVWQGPDRGWPRTLHAETGAPLDATPDLYDYAFALFALGWRHKATGATEALGLAHQTLDIIEARFRHPGGGFHHELPAGPPRQQNPHMHLTEAALVLAESTREQRFTDLANEIVALFRTRLVRLPDGVLPEFFDDDWRPLAGERGRWTEPGHHFEWAWILAQHQKLAGVDNRTVIRALVDRAEAFGVESARAITYNAVREDGAPLDKGSRTWPNTERLKGWLGRHEATGEAPGVAIGAASASARLLLDRYLGAPSPEGAWMDAFDADGAPAATAIPASTFYHVFLAFAEFLRRAPAFA